MPDVSLSTILMAPIAFLAAIIGVIVLLCSAKVVSSSVSLLFSLPPSMTPSYFSLQVLLGAINGVFAGVALALLTSLRKKPSAFTKPWVSALFSKGFTWSSFDRVFWGRVVITVVVAAVVGALSGSGGMLGPTQFANGTAVDVLQSVGYPIVLLAGGGGGGPGADGLWGLLFFILVILATSIMLGLLSTFLVHIVSGAIASGTKAATKEYVTQILNSRAESTQQDGVFKPMLLSALWRGVVIGLLVGVIQAAFTTTGVLRFYPLIPKSELVDPALERSLEDPAFPEWPDSTGAR